MLPPPPIPPPCAPEKWQLLDFHQSQSLTSTKQEVLAGFQLRKPTTYLDFTRSKRGSKTNVTIFEIKRRQVRRQDPTPCEAAKHTSFLRVTQGGGRGAGRVFYHAPGTWNFFTTNGISQSISIQFHPKPWAQAALSGFIEGSLMLSKHDVGHQLLPQRVEPVFDLDLHWRSRWAGCGENDTFADVLGGVETAVSPLPVHARLEEFDSIEVVKHVVQYAAGQEDVVDAI